MQGKNRRFVKAASEAEAKRTQGFAIQKQALERYFENLAALAREREEINGKIAVLERAIRGMLESFSLDASFASLEEEEAWERRLREIIGPGKFIGLTEAVRRAVMKSTGVTAKEVRDLVMSKYPSLRDYRNPLAAIHTVLNRLCKGIDVESFVRQDGSVAYRLANLDPL